MPSTNNTDNTRAAEKILLRIRGLRDHMQPDEEPILDTPAIWDNGLEQRSKPCDVILTNQRLIGYVFVRFPRERLFLEAFPLVAISSVSFRHKSHEAMFRELLISDGQRKVYIRAPRQKIETLYSTLRSAIEQYTANAQPQVEDEQPDEDTEDIVRPTPVYGRQEIRAPLERSPLGMTMLFVGGILLELIGIGLWAATGDVQIGLPLSGAGFLAIVIAILTRRQTGNR